MGKGGQQRRKLLRDKADYAIRHGLAERRVLSEAEAFRLLWSIHNNKAAVFSITRLCTIDVNATYLLPQQMRLGWINRLTLLTYASLSRRTGIILQLLRAGARLDKLFDNSFCNAKTTQRVAGNEPGFDGGQSGGGSGATAAAAAAAATRGGGTAAFSSRRRNSSTGCKRT